MMDALLKIKSDQNGIESSVTLGFEMLRRGAIKSDQNGIESRMASKFEPARGWG